MAINTFGVSLSTPLPKGPVPLDYGSALAAIPTQAARGNTPSDQDTTVSQILGPSQSSTGNQPTAHKRLRASKACERCKWKRIKCSGIAPCQACIKSSDSSTCTIRLRARQARKGKKDATGSCEGNCADCGEPGTSEEGEHLRPEITSPLNQEGATSKYASAYLLDRGSDLGLMDLMGQTGLLHSASSISPTVHTQTFAPWPMSAPNQNPPDSDVPSIPLNGSAPFVDPTRSPLAQIQSLLSAWCSSTGETSAQEMCTALDSICRRRF
jgi:hypothetical protein